MEQLLTPELISSVVNVLGALLLAVLSVLVSVLIKWINKKFKININTQIEDMLDKYIEKGVLYAEHKAETALKTKSEKISSYKKYQEAYNFIFSLAEKAGLNIDKEVLSKLIESKLKELKVFSQLESQEKKN